MKKVKTIPSFSDFPINKISALLLNMKLKGVVRHLLGKLFEAVQLQCYQQPHLGNVNNRQKNKTTKHFK